jgi:hypothetical protein
MERKTDEPIGAPGSRYWLIVAADGNESTRPQDPEDMHKPPDDVPLGSRVQLVKRSKEDGGEWEEAYNEEMPPGDGWSATMHPGYIEGATTGPRLWRRHRFRP